MRQFSRGHFHQKEMTSTWNKTSKRTDTNIDFSCHLPACRDFYCRVIWCKILDGKTDHRNLNVTSFKSGIIFLSAIFFSFSLWTNTHAIQCLFLNWACESSPATISWSHIWQIRMDLFLSDFFNCAQPLPNQHLACCLCVYPNFANQEVHLEM